MKVIIVVMGDSFTSNETHIHLSSYIYIEIFMPEWLLRPQYLYTVRVDKPLNFTSFHNFQELKLKSRKGRN